MPNEKILADVGDTLDTVFIYNDGWKEDSSFYLCDIYSDEEVPTESLSIQSPIGKAVYHKTINDVCEIEGSQNKILIVDIHKRTKNMGYRR